MDIRTKFVFALVAVSLGSMLVFGVILYGDVRAELSERLLNQLDGVAESKREALIEIVEGWHERVGLIASRTQLRVSLDAYQRTGQAAEVARIRRILEDAMAAARFVSALRVDDASGRPVVAVGVELGRPGRAVPSPADDGRYEGVLHADSGPPLVDFSRTLVYEERAIGTLHARLEADELSTLTGNYRGLGETGETLIVGTDEDGTARLLHSPRHPGPDPSLGLPADPSLPSLRALRGEEGRFSDGVHDYRGEPVWAVTRYRPETGWGLVVKVDADEEAGPIRDFGARMLEVALIVAAFAILGGALLGLRFAGPILHLSEVADRVRGGEMEARADVYREDEVGQLSRTFNQMADELEDQMQRLEEYKTFFDVSVDMMCISGTDGYFRRVNPAFERTLGWSRSDLLERPFFDFVHPDDLEATRSELAALAEGRPTISFSNRWQLADGSYRRLRWTAHPDPAAGVVYAIARLDDGDPGAEAS